jgi:hypothetical protein
VEAKKLRDKAVMRLICIIAGSIMAAFLVPLAARARLTPPRQVEAPVRSADWRDEWEWVSSNDYDRGMLLSPDLAAQGDKLYVMWSRQVGTGDEDYDPHYNFSASYGDLYSWGADINIQATTLASKTVYVDMALDSTGAPHFVWAENTVTPYSYTLYYSSTHIANIQLITQYDDALQPAIAVGSSYVHVVWSQGDQDIMYSRKPRTGGSWDSATPVRSSATAVQDPNIAVDGSDTVHVVWSEGEEPDNTDIRYKNSDDWPVWSGFPATVYNGSVFVNGIGYRPDIALSGSNVYVVWCAFKDDDQQYVRFRQSTNGGSSWGSSSQLISGDALAANANSPKYLRPGIAVDTNAKIHVAFNGSTTGVNGNEQIFYVSKKQEGSWRERQNVTGVNAYFNNTTPAIATSGEYVHLIWARQNMPPKPTSRYDVAYNRASIIELEDVFLPLIIKSY